VKTMTTIALLLFALTTTTAWAQSAEPKPAKKKPAAMSEEKRRDLERRIEALEQKHEMQYRETDSPSGAPGATEPAPAAGKPAAQ
jgi:hypothetical protein